MASIDTWLELTAAQLIHPSLPLVSLCYAQSLDGSLAMRRGEPLALSGPASQQLTHRLRAAHDAILVGIGTVLADNPQLTARLSEGENPQPVVLDSRLSMPDDAYLLAGHPIKPWIVTTETSSGLRCSELSLAGAKVLVCPADEFGRVSLPEMLAMLYEFGVRRLMVEGWARIITSFLQQRLVDRVVITVSPVFVGGLHAVEQPLAGFPRLEEMGWEAAGTDLTVWGRIKYAE